MLNVLGCVWCAGDVKPPMTGPPPGEFEGASSRPQDPSNPSGPSDISSNKPAWFDPQHMGPWNPSQPVKTCVSVCVSVYVAKCARERESIPFSECQVTNKDQEAAVAEGGGQSSAPPSCLLNCVMQ